MQSNLGRVALGAAALAAAVVLLIVLKDGGSDEDGDANGGAAVTTADRKGAAQGGGQADKPAEPQIPTITVRNGKPVGGIEELSYDAGESVRFRVESNESDEVHVHGYDVEEEVGPGDPAVFRFPATIEGVFEGELHGSGEQILELRVNP